MRNGSLTRCMIGLVAALAVATGWPQTGLDHRPGPGIDGPAPAVPAASAFGAPVVELEVGDPGSGSAAEPAHVAAPNAARDRGAPAGSTSDLSISLALQGFLARPSRAPPALSG